jgi:CRP/FNR family transcriptional regulator
VTSAVRNGADRGSSFGDDPRVTDNRPVKQPTHTYPRGVELFHQGHALQEGLYIVSGTVKLIQFDGTGGESIIGLTLSGEWLGTASVIANKPTPVTAVTCSTAVLSGCPAGTFRRLLHDDPQLSLQIHQAHALELYRQTTRIGQLCSLNSRARLQSVLCLFAGASRLSQKASAIRLNLPLKRWELASFVGVTPEHLSRLLKDMEHDGQIRRENGWIMLRDLESLSEDR